MESGHTTNPKEFLPLASYEFAAIMAQNINMALEKKDVMTWGGKCGPPSGDLSVFNEEADRRHLKQVVTIKAQQHGKGAVGCAS